MIPVDLQLSHPKGYVVYREVQIQPATLAQLIEKPTLATVPADLPGYEVTSVIACVASDEIVKAVQAYVQEQKGDPKWDKAAKLTPDQVAAICGGTDSDMGAKRKLSAWLNKQKDAK